MPKEASEEIEDRPFVFPILEAEAVFQVTSSFALSKSARLLDNQALSRRL